MNTNEYKQKYEENIRRANNCIKYANEEEHWKEDGYEARVKDWRIQAKIWHEISAHWLSKINERDYKE